MADAVTSQTLVDGTRTAVMKFTNISDGNGEASVVKVDVSALNSHPDGTACSRVHITQVWYSISGMRIDLEWAADTNVKALILGGGALLNQFGLPVGIGSLEKGAGQNWIGELLGG